MTFESIIQTTPPILQRKLEQLKFLRERPDYHPEPSVYEHIKIVTERLILTEDMNLIIAGILHDICKLDTVKMNPKTGWPTSPGHDDAAFELIHSSGDIFDWIERMNADPNLVALICKNHMRFHQLEEMKPSKKSLYVQKWIESKIYDYLQIFGAADNMLEDFDLDNLEKSWKNRKTKLTV